MKKEEDFVMGLSIYMACLREKTVFHGEELSRCLELVRASFCGMEAIPGAY